jgi:hypothetical protein
LIALRILYDDLGAAIHGKNLGYLGLFEPCQVGFVIAEKIGQGVNLSGVEHGGISII